MNRILISILFSLLAVNLMAATEIHPDFTWTVYNANGEPIDTIDNSYQGSAPVTATMLARVIKEDDEGNEEEYTDAVFYGAWCKWSLGGQMENPDLSNPNNPTEFTFRSAGTDSIAYVGYVDITMPDGTVEHIDLTPTYMRNYKDEYIFIVKTYDSKLYFPNAFSPNDDGYNEIYKAKEAQSIIEFHAKIFNRWGQKLYEWDNVNGGWDGTYHGKPVKDGVYYVQVKAKGADGQEFVIKKDVNLMRGYEENSYNNSSTQ